MKRPTATNNLIIINDTLFSQPGKCKYKMKVNLTEELKSLALGKENVNRHEDNREKQREKQRELEDSKERSVGKLMSRSMSRPDLKCQNRMLRSDSEIMRKSFGDARLNTKTQEFAYKSLLRNFDKKLKSLKLPSTLTQQHLCQILRSLGFLPPNLSPQDTAMLSTLRYMLTCSSHFGVTPNNLFNFLLVISNINPEMHQHQGPSSHAATALSKQKDIPKLPLVLIEIGSFTSDGDWKTTSEERKKIRKIFGKLYYNKISSEELKYKQIDQEQRPSFQPKILQNSRSIAEIRRAKMLRQANEYCDLRGNKCEAANIADLLILDRKVKEGRISLKIKEKEDREQNQCTFQPKINKTSQSLKTQYSGNSSCQSKDRCLELFEKSKESRLSKVEIKKPTVEQIQANELKECTFKPVSTKYIGPKPALAPVKNQKKLVQRLKQGRQLRMLNQTFLNRGYPQNQNWDRFVKQHKKKTFQHIANNSSASKLRTESLNGDRSPILSMDIKLHSDTFQLQVYEGDSIESLTCKILVRHELPYERFARIAELITNVVSGCKGMTVLNGIVHETSV